MIDARETAPGVAPVVTTLPKPVPQSGWLFDETSEWRIKDSLWMRNQRYTFQVQHPVSLVFVTPTT